MIYSITAEQGSLDYQYQKNIAVLNAALSRAGRSHMQVIIDDGLTLVKFNAVEITPTISLIEHAYAPGYTVILSCGERSVVLSRPLVMIRRLKELQNALA